MTALKFLIDANYGCCKSGEIMQLSKEDRPGYLKLLEWAREEMKNRNIPIEEPQGVAKT